MVVKVDEGGVVARSVFKTEVGLETRLETVRIQQSAAATKLANVYHVMRLPTFE
jgi:hypothetical protein